MRKPQIVIKLSPHNYARLANLGNRVVASLSGNLNFTTPAITLLALTTATTAVVTAIGVWGPKGNRGSHADLVNLRQKALTLFNLLRAEADYVQTTSQIAAGNDYVAMNAIITTSGFDVKNNGGPQGEL